MEDILRPSEHGTGNRITREEALRVRQRYLEGASVTLLSEEFGHDSRIIKAILRGTHRAVRD